MKSLPLICLIFCCCFNLKAQETTPSNKEYLFDSFTDGKALLKNKRFNQTKFNYNCVYQELHFLNNGEDMTMDNNSNIDTIYIDNRKFIPHLNRFLEYIPVNNTVLLVDYKTKAVPFAKKGAFGIATQGSVQAIDANQTRQQKMGSTDNYVYKYNPENTYYLLQNQKRKKFTNAKSFLKLFPKEQSESISSFIKDQKISLNQVNDIVKLLEFATQAQ